MSRPRALQSEPLWLGVSGGCFVLAGVVYLEFGFVYGFLPLLCGIFASRQWLYYRTTNTTEPADGDMDLTDRYAVDPDTEYSTAEQLEILMELRSDYRSKRLLWAGLALVCAVIGILIVSLSIVTALCSGGLASYCALRWYRLRQALSVLDERIATLSTTT